MANLLAIPTVRNTNTERETEEVTSRWPNNLSFLVMLNVMPRALLKSISKVGDPVRKKEEIKKGTFYMIIHSKTLFMCCLFPSKFFQYKISSYLNEYTSYIYIDYSRQESFWFVTLQECYNTQKNWKILIPHTIYNAHYHFTH